MFRTVWSFRLKKLCLIWRREEYLENVPSVTCARSARSWFYEIHTMQIGIELWQKEKMLVFTNMPRKMTEAWNAARSWQKEMDVWRFYGKDKIWLSITERHLRGQEYLGSCHGKLSHDKFSQKSCFGNEMAHLLYQSRRMDRVWKSMSRVSHRCERFGKDRVHCSWWRWIARYSEIGYKISSIECVL